MEWPCGRSDFDGFRDDAKPAPFRRSCNRVAIGQPSISEHEPAARAASVRCVCGDVVMGGHLLRRTIHVVGIGDYRGTSGLVQFATDDNGNTSPRGGASIHLQARSCWVVTLIRHCSESRIPSRNHWSSVPSSRLAGQAYALARRVVAPSQTSTVNPPALMPAPSRQQKLSPTLEAAMIGGRAGSLCRVSRRSVQRERLAASSGVSGNLCQDVVAPLRHGELVARRGDCDGIGGGRIHGKWSRRGR